MKVQSDRITECVYWNKKALGWKYIFENKEKLRNLQCCKITLQKQESLGGKNIYFLKIKLYTWSEYEFRILQRLSTADESDKICYVAKNTAKEIIREQISNQKIQTKEVFNPQGQANSQRNHLMSITKWCAYSIFCQFSEKKSCNKEAYSTWSLLVH